MPIWHAVVLGLVQGLTEFLPVSSSGHLLLVPWLFGWNDFDDPGTAKAFDVALHLGTLMAVVVYLRADLQRYIGAGVTTLVRREKPTTTDGRIAWLLLFATVPAALVGAVFGDTIDEQLGKPVIIAVSLIVFGVLLGVADRVLGARKIDGLTWRDALAIGAAQALALNPGTSRSGITMTASRFLGFSRETAATVSFLMMVPITAGAVLVKFVDLARDWPPGLLVPMLVGILTSAISGWFAVWGLLRFVRSRSFTPFVVYRVVLGVVVLVIVAIGWR